MGFLEQQEASSQKRYMVIYTLLGLGGCLHGPHFNTKMLKMNVP